MFDGCEEIYTNLRETLSYNPDRQTRALLKCGERQIRLKMQSNTQLITPSSDSSYKGYQSNIKVEDIKLWASQKNWRSWENDGSRRIFDN